MNRLIIAGALCMSALIVGAAWAGANCKAYPKAEWMSEADAKTKITAMGYAINVFKVDGNCYEIYGRNKDNKKVEIYFDAKTLEVVKSEIEK